MIKPCLYGLYQLSQGFTSARLFTADTESPLYILVREKWRKQMVLVFIQWIFPPKLPDLLKSCDTPLCNRPSRIHIFTHGFSEKTSLDWFIFHWCTSHKSGKGWQALHLYCNFECLLIKIIAVSRSK